MKKFVTVKLDCRIKIILHPGNEPVLKMGKLERGNVSKHPPCSTALAPSDIHLFPAPTKFSPGNRFGLKADMMTAVDGYLTGLQGSHYKDEI